MVLISKISGKGLLSFRKMLLCHIGNNLFDIWNWLLSAGAGNQFWSNIIVVANNDFQQIYFVVCSFHILKRGVIFYILKLIIILVRQTNVFRIVIMWYYHTSFFVIKVTIIWHYITTNLYYFWY